MRIGSPLKVHLKGIRTWKQFHFHRKKKQNPWENCFLVEDFGEESYVFGERNCLDHQDYTIKSMKVS